MAQGPHGLMQENRNVQPYRSNSTEKNKNKKEDMVFCRHWNWLHLYVSFANTAIIATSLLYFTVFLLSVGQVVALKLEGGGGGGACRPYVGKKHGLLAQYYYSSSVSYKIQWANSGCLTAKIQFDEFFYGSGAEETAAISVS
jgi:hypothetical protein